MKFPPDFHNYNELIRGRIKFRSRHSEMLFKIISSCREKDLCGESSIMKLLDPRTATLLKRDCNSGCFL